MPESEVALVTDLQGDEDGAGTDGEGDDGHERTHHQV